MSSNQLAGVIGFFSGPSALLEAMKKAKAAKYESVDAYSPFPIHGMDDAQGLKRSFLPYITFAFGLTGFITAFALQYWTSAVDWPLNVGGKPLNSWPAFVPIMFELTVLFAGVSTGVGMILINRLPNVTKKSFDARLTSDRFALLIETVQWDRSDEEENQKHASFKPFNEAEATQFLSSIGAQDVRSVKNEGWFG